MCLSQLSARSANRPSPAVSQGDIEASSLQLENEFLAFLGRRLLKRQPLHGIPGNQVYVTVQSLGEFHQTTGAFCTSVLSCQQGCLQGTAATSLRGVVGDGLLQFWQWIFSIFE